MKRNKIIYSEDKVKNWSLIRKRIFISIIAIWIIIISYIFTYISGYNNGDKKNKIKTEIEILNYKNEIYYDIFEEKNFENPYNKLNKSILNMDFQMNLNDEKADFIIRLSNKLNIDPNFCIAVLYKENTSLVEKAFNNKNKDGTVDVGMWQINSSNLRSMGSDNKKAFDIIYWPFDKAFEPFNWKHNTWIAIHHLADLYYQFGDYEKTYQAYNGGPTNVYNDKVSELAQSNSKIVMNTYKKITEELK